MTGYQQAARAGGESAFKSAYRALIFLAAVFGVLWLAWTAAVRATRRSVWKGSGQ